MTTVPSRQQRGRWCLALPTLCMGFVSLTMGAEVNHSVTERLYLLLGRATNAVLRSYPDIRQVPPSVRDFDRRLPVTEYYRLPSTFAQEQGFNRIDIGVHETIVVVVEAVKSVATWHDYAKAQKQFLPSPAQIKQIGDPKKGSVLLVSDSTNAEGVPVCTKIMMSAMYEPWELSVAFGYTEFMEAQTEGRSITPDPALVGTNGVQTSP